MIRNAESFDNLTPKELGDRIRRARQAKELTLQKLAFEMGMHHGQLSRIERGLFKRASKHVLRICTFLGVKTHDLDLDRLCERVRATIRTPQAARAMSAFLDAVDSAQNG